MEQTNITADSNVNVLEERHINFSNDCTGFQNGKIATVDSISLSQLCPKLVGEWKKKYNMSDDVLLQFYFVKPQCLTFVAG